MIQYRHSHNNHLQKPSPLNSRGSYTFIGQTNTYHMETDIKAIRAHTARVTKATVLTTIGIITIRENVMATSVGRKSCLQITNITIIISTKT